MRPKQHSRIGQKTTIFTLLITRERSRLLQAQCNRRALMRNGQALVQRPLGTAARYSGARSGRERDQPCTSAEAVADSYFQLGGSFLVCGGRG